MARSSRHPLDLSHFESVARITSLPFVENSLTIAGNVYKKIKHSNSLVSWSLDTAENSLAMAAKSAKPAIFAFNGPILSLDQLLCKGIDIVEQRVPAVNLPPQLLYWNTREFVSKKFVKPVLKRADSVKYIGSQAAEAAADRLDGALCVADKYVDRYLPADPTDKAPEDANPIKFENKTTRTIIHGARFSKKLKRRLTRRTLEEAKALKHQSTECIHVLLYVVELIATDPKMALKKGKELWAALSLPEPGNQARPATLEQLIVLLTRESARRIVHFVNGIFGFSSRAPRRIGINLMTISHQLLSLAETAIKMTPVIGTRKKIDSQISMIQSSLEKLKMIVNSFLERSAIYLAGRPEPKKALSNSRGQNHNNHVNRVTNRPVNGID